MNKEELEKEAEVFATYYESLFPNEFETFYKAFLKVAEPREKQIQIDAEQILALQKQNGELTDKVKELKAQIEKMKNCFNCAKGDWNNRVKCIKSGCVNKNKWELAE